MFFNEYKSEVIRALILCQYNSTVVVENEVYRLLTKVDVDELYLLVLDILMRPTTKGYQNLLQTASVQLVDIFVNKKLLATNAETTTSLLLKIEEFAGLKLIDYRIYYNICSIFQTLANFGVEKANCVQILTKFLLNEMMKLREIALQSLTQFVCFDQSRK